MTRESGKRKAESGVAALQRNTRRGEYTRTSPCAALRHGLFRNPAFIHKRNGAIRNGVTLIELLVTMAIIAILSTVIVGASTSAIEAARRARTKTMIVKLHTLLMERYESYQTRRVDVNTSNMSGQQAADVRLLGVRELMKLEMPDRWSDVIADSVPDANPLFVGVIPPTVLGSLPSLTSAYRRRYFNLRTNDGIRIRSNQGAECLYMIIMLATGDGEARTLFGQQDIGDTDGDGAPEFLDGWGNSIQFIRWPAGFVDESELMSGDADADHDPFDPFRRDQEGTGSSSFELSDNKPAYRLVPLLYSRGSDGETDLVVDTGAVVELDPYAAKYGTPNTQLGTVRDTENDGEGWHDNIHNHLLD